MKDQRFETMRQLNSEGYDFSWKDFTISEVIEIVNETPLTERDRQIAILRFTKLYTFQELADKLNVSIETIKANVPKIEKSLKETCKRLFVR